ncbi:tyrosine-protein phosphatase [Parasediminibacterium sp. JCM 36343]|uniref:tyrosine-protein phosphatase n=1 Tax=Parasediminibacterium sp. JCM 36343 TaxID=3374279 RepID=UPI003979F8B0
MNFSFFNKTIKPDLSFLTVDMHSHLLPGIDDGLKTVEDSVIFIKELYALGYRKLICTPHILAGIHDNTPETILPALALVRQALAAEDIQMTVDAAAEYMIDREFGELIKEDKQLLTFGKNYILVEMSYVAASPNLHEVLFALQMKGYNPIMAHPERYNFYHDDFEKYEQLKDRNVLFQVNILSLLGYYGKPVKKTAEKLIEKGMVNFIGTDMHHQTHLNATKQFVSSKEFYKLAEKIQLLNASLL